MKALSFHWELMFFFKAVFFLDMRWRVRGEILRWVAEKFDRGGDLETEREVLSVGGRLRRAHEKLERGRGIWKIAFEVGGGGY